MDSSHEPASIGTGGAQPCACTQGQTLPAPEPSAVLELAGTNAGTTDLLSEPAACTASSTGQFSPTAPATPCTSTMPSMPPSPASSGPTEAASAIPIPGSLTALAAMLQDPNGPTVIDLQGQVLGLPAGESSQVLVIQRPGVKLHNGTLQLGKGAYMHICGTAAKDVQLVGLTIKGPGSTEHGLVQISNTACASIDSCTLRLSDNSKAEKTNGILARGRACVQIRSCKVSKAGYGVRCTERAHMSVHDTAVHNCRVYAFSSSDADMECYGCSASDCGDSGYATLQSGSMHVGPGCTADKCKCYGE